MTDPIENAIHFSLSALAERSRVTDANLANVNTPGYLAKATNFEDSLTQALSNNDDTVRLNSREYTTLHATNVNGNNVDLDNETVTAMDTQLKYQTMINAMNSKFRLLKTAIGTF